VKASEKRPRGQRRDAVQTGAVSRSILPRRLVAFIFSLARGVGLRREGRPALAWGVMGASGVMLAGLVACGHNVGDSCRVSSDCDPTGGSRVCDVSQPGGYCLVEGCDEYSCPSDSACIRLFPTAFLSKPCDPTALKSSNGTATGETGCAPNEICLDIGQCVLRSLERRECLATCGDNGDCRGGYECRRAGTEGSMPLVRDSGIVRFCAPL